MITFTHYYKIHVLCIDTVCELLLFRLGCMLFSWMQARIWTLQMAHLNSITSGFRALKLINIREKFRSCWFQKWKFELSTPSW